VKYFAETGLLLRNPDNPSRPTNSGQTVYQVEPTALALVRTYGTKAWTAQLKEYLANRAKIRHAVERERNLARIPVKLLSGETVTLSPGGQNPLIKQIIEEFCSRFASGATVVYIGDPQTAGGEGPTPIGPELRLLVAHDSVFYPVARLVRQCEPDLPAADSGTWLLCIR
jgi:hypothetical protein